MTAELQSAPYRIVVHFDFASTICYVGHRMMERMQDRLAALEIELDWWPLDLTRMIGTPRDRVVPDGRREHARRIGRELEVPVEPPMVWVDSRVPNACALVARRKGRDPGWRERIWTAIFEERREILDLDTCLHLARDIHLNLSTSEIEDGMQELEKRTLDAIHAEVTGVPTFMLGSWPFGGIQTEATMDHILTRYAKKQRAGAIS